MVTWNANIRTLHGRAEIVYELRPWKTFHDAKIRMIEQAWKALKLPESKDALRTVSMRFSLSLSEMRFSLSGLEFVVTPPFTDVKHEMLAPRSKIGQVPAIRKAYVVKYPGYTVRHAQWGVWSFTVPLVLISWSVAAPVGRMSQQGLAYIGVVADGRNQSVEISHRTRLVVLMKFIHGALTSAIIALLRRCLRSECFRSRRSEALPLVSLLAVP